MINDKGNLKSFRILQNCSKRNAYQLQCLRLGFLYSLKIYRLREFEKQRNSLFYYTTFPFFSSNEIKHFHCLAKIFSVALSIISTRQFRTFPKINQFSHHGCRRRCHSSRSQPCKSWPSFLDCSGNLQSFVQSYKIHGN